MFPQKAIALQLGAPLGSPVPRYGTTSRRVRFASRRSPPDWCGGRLAPKSERPLLDCASLAAAEAVTASMPCPGLKHHADPATNSMRGVGVGLDHQRLARKIGDGIGVRWCNRQVAI